MKGEDDEGYHSRGRIRNEALSRYQAKLLVERARFGTVLIAYDADATDYSDKALQMLQPVISRVEVVKLPSETDPGELGFNEMSRLLKEEHNVRITRM